MPARPLKIMYLNPVADNPDVDPSIAALKRAEYAAVLKRQCGWVPSRKDSCESPTEEEMARFDAFGGNAPVLGSRIVVERSNRGRCRSIRPF